MRAIKAGGDVKMRPGRDRAGSFRRFLVDEFLKGNDETHIKISILCENY
jgi:hypothetical protein